VVGGCVVVVVGGCVVGVCFAGGCVVGVDEVDGVVDGVTGDTVPFVDDAEELAVDVVVVGIFVVVGVVVAPPVAGEDAVAAAAGADDLPFDSTANQSLSTPCPLASPFFLSLTNV
jgi:hypothetical protein